MPDFLRGMPGVPLIVIGIIATVVSSLMFVKMLRKQKEDKSGAVKKTAE